MAEKSLMRMSLRARVAFGVALPIFIVLATLSFYNYSREYQLWDEQARLDAVQLGDLMIHSLNHAMLTKDGEHLISSLGDVSQLENVEFIQVIGSSGKVLADSSGEINERIMHLSDEECQTCHRYSAEERPRVIPLELSVRGWRISAPVNNLPQCYDCHDESLTHLGVLLMDISLTGKQRHLLIDLQSNLLISVASTGLVSLMSYLLVQRLVVRRIESFQEPLSEYTDGKFSTRITTSSGFQDELCDLADTFNQMADEIERHAKEEEERHQLRERAVIEERERIARELHDGFAQVLGYVNTKVMAVRLLVRDRKLREADQQLIHLENAARGLFTEVREAILGLKMSGRMQIGFIETLSEYIDEFSRLSGIPTAFISNLKQENGLISPDTELHLFRIVQESLNNIRKHAKANKAWVELSKYKSGFRLEIGDDGIGFDSNLIKNSETEQFGLNNMLERASEIGAEFNIITDFGEGTRIVIEMPLIEPEKTL